MPGSVCRDFERKILKNSLDRWKIAPETLEIHNIDSFQLLAVALWWQSMGWKIFLSQNQLITQVWVHFQQVWKKNVKVQQITVENNPDGIKDIQYRLLLAASEGPLMIDFGKKKFLQIYIRIHLPINFGDSSSKMKFWHFLELFGYFLGSLAALWNFFSQFWPHTLLTWVSRFISWKF